MRRNLPRYVERIVAKGREYFYFRQSRRGQRIKMPGRPGDAEFEIAYLRLMHPATSERAAPGEGTVGAMIRDYRGSDEYLALKPKTQRGYERMLNLFEPIDPYPASDIKRRHIRELRKGLAGKGRSQQSFSQVASLLFNFGVDNDYCETNPAARMKRPDRAKAFKAWSEANCAAFEASHPPRHVLTGYMLGRYTGQRRSDVLKMARSAIAGDRILVRPRKIERHIDAGEVLRIPIHTRLRAYIADLPKDALMLIADAAGRPVDESRFTKDFRLALNAAGLPDLHFHGLRHTAGKALAEAGCTAHEIMAVLGHRTLAMAQKYTTAVEQGRLASAAITKLEGSV